MSARVLVVDDDDDIRELLDLVLFDCNVFRARNLTEARDALKAADPPIEVIVLDVMLGGEDGLDLLDDPELPPVVVLSGVANHTHLDDDPRVFSHLTKPFKVEALRGIVQGAIQRVTEEEMRFDK